MTKRSAKEILTNIPLFLGGIFMIYLAAADETLFNFILGNTIQNQLTVALATTVAAAVPMFFAVGMIKQSIVSGLYTIYYYEKMLQGSIFWILSIILLIITAAIIVIEGVHQFNIPILAGCGVLSMYLIIYTIKIRKK
jgi:hypothetical protein